jgi:hypothetical protein
VRRTGADAEAHGPFLITVRSAANPAAADVVRQRIEREVAARVTATLTGADAQLRSELTLAVMAGVWLLRHVIATQGLADADPERLAQLLTRVFDVLVEE